MVTVCASFSVSNLNEKKSVQSLSPDNDHIDSRDLEGLLVGYRV